MIYSKDLSWLKFRTEKSPDNVFINYNKKELTYGEVYEYTKNLASLLIKNGIVKNDRVGIFLPNVPEFIYSIFAILEIGAVVVPINYRLTMDEVSWQAGKVNLKSIIVFNEDRNRLPQLEMINPRNQVKSPFVDASRFEGRDIATLVFTSGTTGTPKVVPLSFDNHFYSAVNSADRLKFNETDNWILTMPLYHLGGLSIVFRSCLFGSKFTLTSKFDIDEILNYLSDAQITCISLVPTMLSRLIDRDSNNYLKRLKFILLGGSAPSKQLLEESVRLELPIALTYGMTETCSQFLTAPPHFQKMKLGSVGKPLAENTYIIVDDKGELVTHNEIGELCVKGPTLMPGYLGSDLTTTDHYHKEFFKTGDFAFEDSDQDIYIVQRRTDLIITGGENVYPKEVEDTLRDLSYVGDAVVIGLSDEEWGQVVIAVIKPEGKVEAKKIQNDLRSRLAAYKIPQLIFSLQEFPRTASGKIIRSEIVEMIKIDMISKLD